MPCRGLRLLILWANIHERRHPVHIVIPDHDVSISTPDRIEIDARRVTLFTSSGESYVISQNADGTLRIEAPQGELRMDIVSETPRVARLTARGSCEACSRRISKGLEGRGWTCGSAAVAPQRPRATRHRLILPPPPHPYTEHLP